MATLADLRSRFYNRFDASPGSIPGGSPSSGYIGQDEANALINEGARHLHNWVVTVAEYYIWKEFKLPLVAGQSDYELPLDFQKLLKVFAPQGILSGGAEPAWWPMRRMMPEEYRGQNFGAWQSPAPQVVQAYMMMGQTLRIFPTPGAIPGELLLWYVPQYKDLVEDTDVSEVSNDPGWDEFIINQAVIAARIKEESDTTQLERRQAQIMEMIQTSMINRDMGKHERVVDVEGPVFF